MEAVTPSTSRSGDVEEMNDKEGRNDEEEYPRFNNMIILGSKPSKFDLFTFEQNRESEESCDENESEDNSDENVSEENPDENDSEENPDENDSEENSDENVSKENSDDNDSSVVATSSTNSEVCKHCNKIYPDKELLLMHLLEVATKYDNYDRKTAKRRRSSHDNTTEILDVDQNTPPDSENTLKHRRKYRSTEIGEEISPKSVDVDHSFLNTTSDDAKINKKDLNRNKEDENTNTKYFYKCRDCHEDFADYSAARVHKLNKHPTTERRHLFFKCSALKSEASAPKNKPEINSNKEKEVAKDEIENAKIQEDTKSSQNYLKRKLSHDVNKRLITNDETYDEGRIVEEMTTNEDNGNEKVAKLFKCPCGLHYTSYKVLQKHFKVCSPMYKVSKQDCSKCGILFSTDSLVDHLCKHHTSDKYKFKVVNMTPDARTHNCEFCHVTFFSKADLNIHIEECKCVSNPRDSIAPEECTKPKQRRASIDPTDLKRKYNKKIEVNKPSKTSQKCPNSANVNRRQEQFTIYKCYKCDVHYLKLPSIRYHFEVVNHQMCVKVVPCEFCGLNFTYSSMKKHVYLHHTKNRCVLKDLHVQIVDESMNWNKSVEPKNDNAEDLTDYNDTCQIKQKKDLPHGKVQKRSTAVRSSTPHIQELTNNYEEKLFKCGLCPIHFMTKHALYKHMKSDHISMELCNESSADCTICGYTFDVKTIQDHIIVHHFDMKLKRENIQIIIKDSIKTNADIVSISNKAEDNNSKSLNLNSKCGDGKIRNRTRSQINISKEPIVLDSKSYTERLYKCEKCSVHVMKLNTLQKHICNPSVDSVADDCQICGLKFSSHSMKRHIYVHHSKMKLKRSDFIISLLTQATKENTKPTRIAEKERPKTILQGKAHNLKTGKSYKLSSESKAILDNKSYEKLLYKCDKCSLHFMKFNTLIKHSLYCKPHDKTNKVDCKFCGLKFSSMTLSIHEYAHHKKMKLTLKDFKIITNEENSHDTKISKRRKYVKISEHDLETQVKRKRGRPRKPVVQTNDKLSAKHRKGANINVDETRKHRFKNYILTKKVIEAINSTSYNNCLYKCNICSLHFMRGDTLYKHLQHSKGINHSKGANTAECSECGLNFRMNSLSRHKYVHHIKMKLTPRDLSIKSKPQKNISKTLQSNRAAININEAQIDLEDIRELEGGCIDKTKSNISSKKLQQYSNCLYKCHTCFLHFIGAQTYYRHVAESDHTVLDAKCDMCGLFFSLNSIDIHKEIHHTILKLKPEDIHIVNPIGTSDDKTIHHNKFKINKSSDTHVTTTKTKDNTMEQDMRVKEKVKLENNMQSSRDKIRMALDSIESSTYDINALRQNIAALSKTKKAKMDDVEEAADISISRRDMILLDEDMSVNITEPSRQRIGTSIVFTEPPDDKVVLPINRRKSTKDHIQKCYVNDTPRNMTLLEDRVSSNNDQNQSRQVMETSREFTETSDTMDLIDLETVDILDVASFASQRNIVHSSTPKPNNKIAKRNTSHIENDINATNAESSNNVPVLSAVPRKQNLQAKLNIYNKNLYKCGICNLHFNAYASLQAHVKLTIHEPRITDVCNICNFTFSSRSMKRHKDIHHTLLKLKREDFNIVTVTDKLQKVLKTVSKGKVSAETETEEVTMTSDREDNTTKSPNTMTTDSKNQVKLFKCGKCNVCFVKRNIWFKHTTVHVPLKHKEYTECKLCGFQFAIYTLHKHVEKHHEKDFNLEEVLIEEYMNDGTVETYCAADRVQSKLVSTTTEVVKNTVKTSDYGH